MSITYSDLFTVLGKSIKEVNAINALFATRETGKDAIYTVEAAESLQDLYAPLPATYQGFYDAMAGWIQQLIGHVQSILTDEEYILDELPIFSSDIQTVLLAIYSDMVNRAGDSIDANSVTIASSSAESVRVALNRLDSAPRSSGMPVESLFFAKTLDGVNTPAGNAIANPLYANVTSELPMSCTLFGKVVSSSPGAEVVQIFADSPFQSPYTFDAESPGTGPTVVNAESGNILSNYDFTNWSGDNPSIGWTVSGGAAGTDWADASGTGIGPLQINTAGTLVKQKITGLERLRGYFLAALVKYSGSSGTAVVQMRVENTDGLTVHKDFASVTCADVTSAADQWKYIHGIYVPSASVNLDDIYVTVEHDAESNSGTNLKIYKVVCVPVIYFNGLSVAFWNPYVTSTSQLNQASGGASLCEMPVGSYTSAAIANDHAGTIQTFFCRAFNFQLVSDNTGSETINDSLAE